MDIQFPDELAVQRRTVASPSRVTLTSLLVRWQFARSEKQAVVVLLIVTVGICILAGGIYLTSQPHTSDITPQELERAAVNQYRYATH